MSATKSSETPVWFEDYENMSEIYQVDEYDITSIPNDFNVVTIFNFMETGTIKIPPFQRNYVWDIKRASRLIESLILGLPVPQIFLYEVSRNNFRVIDGQQRLMSIYYFIKKRFPKKEKRAELRRVIDEYGYLPSEVLYEDQYFSNFGLELSEVSKGIANKFSGRNYETLGDYKIQFERRPLRNVIVKQNYPNDDDSAIYEIFNRLNTGGVNLVPQEIRASLYQSQFYDMIYKLNINQEWRRLLNKSELDQNMKDIEIILRCFAFLINSNNYRAPLKMFLNEFSRKSKANDPDRNNYLEQLFLSFLNACRDLPDDAFIEKSNKRFKVALFEAVFVGACLPSFIKREFVKNKLFIEQVRQISTSEEYSSSALEGSSSKSNIERRLEIARLVINAS